MASRSPSSATGARLGHRQHEHLARLQRGHRGVDHQVVVLAAARDPGRPAGARAGNELLELEVDQALRARGLVDGRGAEPRELVRS